MKMIALAGQGVEVSGVPEKIKLLPLGMVKSTKGSFVVDEESFQLIREHFKGRRIDLVIDYEHQTLDNVQAPAAGWIKDIALGPDAITAKVEWTPKAAEYLKNREYRYLSPVILVRKTDKKAVALHSAALTNTPAIDGMFPLAASADIEDFYGQCPEGGIMELNKIIGLLGLPEDATEEEAYTALKEQVASKPAGEHEETVVANSTILSLLGLSEDAKTEDVTASIMALKAGDEQTRQDVQALKEQLAKRDAQELVEKALKEGKIPAAQREWAEGYALKDPEGFKTFLEKAPAVVPMEKLELKDAPKTEVQVDPAILKNLGITEEDVKKYGMEG